MFEGMWPLLFWVWGETIFWDDATQDTRRLGRCRCLSPHAERDELRSARLVLKGIGVSELCVHRVVMMAIAARL